jgi:hypothetical protein
MNLVFDNFEETKLRLNIFFLFILYTQIKHINSNLNKK